MLKLTKQHFYLLLIILIVSIPNLLLIMIGGDSVVASLLKKIVFLVFSTSVIIIPLAFLKPKYYAWFSIILTPFILFEIYNVYTFKAPSSEEAIAALFYTNAYEGFELFKSNLSYAFLFILLLTLLIALNFKIKNNFILAKPIKKAVFIFCFSIFLVILLRDFKIATAEKNTTFNHKLKLVNYLFNVKLNKIFPIDNFKKILKAQKGIKSIKNYQNNIAGFKFNATKKDTVKQQEIYVLVIGETARKNNFELYNYYRKTNPKLSKIKNLLTFDNVKTAANVTSLSLPFLLTRATPNYKKPILNEPAILNVFKESGFKTYWLTNQAAGLNGVFAFYSRLSDYYKNISVSIDVAKYDEDLLPELDKILADKSSLKKFIVVHTLGSHFRYNLRYPDNFKIFKPTLSNTLSITGISSKLKTETVNSYDNSILYTDYVLSKIINKIEKTNSLSYVYYISDHGENLYDDKNNYLMHGFVKPTKYEIDIPLFIWNSKDYHSAYPNKINHLKRNINNKISSTNTFSTLLDLANISFKEEDLTKSFANKKFDTLQSRYLLTPDKKILRLD